MELLAFELRQFPLVTSESRKVQACHILLELESDVQFMPTSKMAWNIVPCNWCRRTVLLNNGNPRFQNDDANTLSWRFMPGTRQHVHILPNPGQLFSALIMPAQPLQIARKPINLVDNMIHSFVTRLMASCCRSCELKWVPRTKDSTKPESEDII